MPWQKHFPLKFLWNFDAGDTSEKFSPYLLYYTFYDTSPKFCLLLFHSFATFCKSRDISWRKTFKAWLFTVTALLKGEMIDIFEEIQVYCNMKLILL